MDTRTRTTAPDEPALPPTHESWLPNEHSLYRPRHAPRQRTALVCAAVFFLAPTVAFVLGVRPAAFENRALSPFPSPVAGWGFFTGLSAWATDHMPLREPAIRAGEAIRTSVFGDPPGTGAGSPAQTGPLSPGSPAPPGSPGSPGGPRTSPANRYPTVISGTDGWLYLGMDTSNKCEPAMDLDQVIGTLRRLREAVESSGRRFVLIVAPDKSTAAPEHLPSHYVGEDCARDLTDRFWRRAVREAGVVDLRGELRRIAGQVGHPIYDAFDSHWTYEGGMAMTYALAERLRPGVTKSWLVTPGEQQAWPADIPVLLHRSEQRALRRYTLAPDGATNLAHYVASDFRAPLRLAQPAEVRGKTGTLAEPVGLIADSFTQFASPFLAAGIQDLVIVHPETVAADPRRHAAELFADRDVVALELAERNVAGGASPLLRGDVVDALGAVLAEHPR